MKRLLIVLSLVSMSALATVDFTVGQVVDKAADGSTLFISQMIIAFGVVY